MSNVVRAWKNEAHRLSLSTKEQVMLAAMGGQQILASKRPAPL